MQLDFVLAFVPYHGLILLMPGQDVELPFWLWKQSASMVHESVGKAIAPPHHSPRSKPSFNNVKDVLPSKWAGTLGLPVCHSSHRPHSHEGINHVICYCGPGFLVAGHQVTEHFDQLSLDLACNQREKSITQSAVLAAWQRLLSVACQVAPSARQRACALACVPVICFSRRVWGTSQHERAS